MNENEILGVKPIDEEHKQILQGIEVLCKIFGDKEGLIKHMAENHGVINHPVPEVMELAKRLGFDKQFSDSSFFPYGSDWN